MEQRNPKVTALALSHFERPLRRPINIPAGPALHQRPPSTITTQSSSVLQPPSVLRPVSSLTLSHSKAPRMTEESQGDSRTASSFSQVNQKHNLDSSSSQPLASHQPPAVHYGRKSSQSVPMKSLTSTTKTNRYNSREPEAESRKENRGENRGGVGSTVANHSQLSTVSSTSTTRAMILRQQAIAKRRAAAEAESARRAKERGSSPVRGRRPAWNDDTRVINDDARPDPFAPGRRRGPPIAGRTGNPSKRGGGSARGGSRGRGRGRGGLSSRGRSIVSSALSTRSAASRPAQGRGGRNVLRPASAAMAARTHGSSTLAVPPRRTRAGAMAADARQLSRSVLQASLMAAAERMGESTLNASYVSARSVNSNHSHRSGRSARSTRSSPRSHRSPGPYSLLHLASSPVRKSPRRSPPTRTYLGHHHPPHNQRSHDRSHEREQHSQQQRRGEAPSASAGTTRAPFKERVVAVNPMRTSVFDKVITPRRRPGSMSPPRESSPPPTKGSRREAWEGELSSEMVSQVESATVAAMQAVAAAAAASADSSVNSQEPGDDTPMDLNAEYLALEAGGAHADARGVTHQHGLSPVDSALQEKLASAEAAVDAMAKQLSEISARYHSGAGLVAPGPISSAASPQQATGVESPAHQTQGSYDILLEASRDGGVPAAPVAWTAGGEAGSEPRLRAVDLNDSHSIVGDGADRGTRLIPLVVPWDMEREAREGKEAYLAHRAVLNGGLLVDGRVVEEEVDVVAIANSVAATVLDDVVNKLSSELATASDSLVDALYTAEFGFQPE